MKIKTIYSLGFRNLNIPISRKSIILLLFISTGKKFVLIFYKDTNYNIHYATERQNKISLSFILFCQRRKFLR